MVVFVFIAVALNLIRYTGKVTDSGIRVYISSDRNILDEDDLEIRAGEYIYITIDPQGKQFHRKIAFINDDGRQAGHTSIGSCLRCRSKQVLSYKTPVNWYPGIYKMRVFDYSKEEYIERFFTVS